MARNMKLITVVQVAFLFVGSSRGFSPPCCRSKGNVRGYFGSELCATQEERDEALARYLEMADQETMETIQRVSFALVGMQILESHHFDVHSHDTTFPPTLDRTRKTGTDPRAQNAIVSKFERCITGKRNAGDAITTRSFETRPGIEIGIPGNDRCIENE